MKYLKKLPISSRNPSDNSVALQTTGDISLSPKNLGNITVTSALIKGLLNPVDPQDAATKFYVDRNSYADNVLYVAQNGDDAQDGRTLANAKRTLKAALAIAQRGTTIFVKSGDYVEENPITVPEGVAVVGDSLRTVTIRPGDTAVDLFWVKNASYLAQMSFKDHEFPSAAVAFPTDGSAGVIHTSPYIQNCSSITTTGTGLRVDGADVKGLRSMVVDSYTQFNQGGIGMHHLNRGNTQLVSVFTICCETSILCESGGFCSLANSNTSFGLYGLKADGVSQALYSGKVANTSVGRTLLLNNLTSRPNVGDAISFNGSDDYYTVGAATALRSNSQDIVSASYASIDANTLAIKESIVLVKNKIQADTINYLNAEYPDFDFDQFKCTRDVGLIIDAVVDDMVFNTNYRSILTGTSYYRATASNVVGVQRQETIDAIEFVKDAVLEMIDAGTYYDSISERFDIIIDIISNGVAASPSYVFTPPPDFASSSRYLAANIIQSNKLFLIEDGIAYIAANYPALTYDQAACRRDIAFIVNAITYDMMYRGNSQTADASDEYFSGGVLQLPTAETAATIATFEYIKSITAACIVNSPVVSLNNTVIQNTSLPPASAAEVEISDSLFAIVTELLTNGYTSQVTLEEVIPESSPVISGADVTFHQYSQISASGHTFEWVGSGTNVNTALPYLGGVAIPENQVIEINGGKVIYTATDQKGDFNIGDELVIRRNTGTIEGRAFSKSLFAVLTPYILAIGD